MEEKRQKEGSRSENFFQACSKEKGSKSQSDRRREGTGSFQIFLTRKEGIFRGVKFVTKSMMPGVREGLVSWGHGILAVQLLP